MTRAMSTAMLEVMQDTMFNFMFLILSKVKITTFCKGSPRRIDRICVLKKKNCWKKVKMKCKTHSEDGLQQCNPPWPLYRKAIHLDHCTAKQSTLITVPQCNPPWSLYHKAIHLDHCTAMQSTLTTVLQSNPPWSLYRKAIHLDHCTMMQSTLTTVPQCNPPWPLYHKATHLGHCTTMQSTLTTVPQCNPPWSLYHNAIHLDHCTTWHSNWIPHTPSTTTKDKFPCTKPH